MFANPKRLRRPEERVGTLPNADLPPPSLSTVDAEHLLVRALRVGDERAFEQLLDRYYSPMLRLATTFVRSREEAEEVIQETWLAVLSGVDRFEERSSFKTWLFRILVNRARARAKRESRMVPFSSLTAPVATTEAGDGAYPAQAPLRAETDSTAWAGAPSRTPTPEEQLLASELRERIDGAIAVLPPRLQAVIALRDVEGWTAEEVCNLLNLSETNQRVLLHRARVRVRDALAPYLDGPGEEEDGRGPPYV